MESESGFNLGKEPAEISRDELKFTKFVQRLRKRFTQVFADILKTQLVLKGIITIEDWAKIGSHIQYDYSKRWILCRVKRGRNFKRKIKSRTRSQSICR